MTICLARAAALLAPLALAPAAHAWNETHKIQRHFPGIYDEFGVAVAISGPLCVVGAHLDNTASELDVGSIHLFDTQTGDFLVSLFASDGDVDDRFGGAVAIRGDLVLAGASWDEPNGDKSGSAYLFDAATGQELFKLVPGDGSIYDRFGGAVALGDGVALVGAHADDPNGASSGSAYVFDTATGQELFKLTPSDGDPGDEFGWSVAVHGTTAIIGAHYDEGAGAGSLTGSAYLFDLTTGIEIRKLEASDGEHLDRFGESVAIHATTALVGAPAPGYGQYDYPGAAYLFDLATGAELARLEAPDGTAYNVFGTSVALSEDKAVVAAPHGDGENFLSGTAYVFEAQTGKLTQKISPSDGAVNDRFGTSVAADGKVVVVGSPQDDDHGDRSGSAYLFHLPLTIGKSYCGPANLNSTGRAATLTATGNTAVNLNLVTLTASDLPPHQVGYFLNSQSEGFVPFVGGSQGNLCLAGSIGRHSKSVANSGSEGQLVLELDLTQLPQPSGPVAAAAGETWHFQCWFRDQNPSSTSNLTDGVRIKFD